MRILFCCLVYLALQGTAYRSALPLLRWLPSKGTLSTTPPVASGTGASGNGLTCLYSVVRKRMEEGSFNPNPNPGTEEDDDEFLMPHLDEPSWLEMFPPPNRASAMGAAAGKSGGAVPIERQYPDFTELKPDDPLFLDMPWPTEAGPEASAFGRHMQWRRKLTDGERIRWQKWAVYQRLLSKDHFQYSVEDYVSQNMIRESNQRAMRFRADGQVVGAALWDAVSIGFATEEAEEVRSLMLSYYSALNRRNYDELRVMWLPDENVECVLPGYERVVGQNEVEKLYRKMVKDSKPFGTVVPTIVSVDVYGFVAVVHTWEDVQAGKELKVARKKNAPPPKPVKVPPRRIFATTILRKFNRQWRVMMHHAARFKTSSFTNDMMALQQKQLSSTGGNGKVSKSGKLKKEIVISNDGTLISYASPSTSSDLQNLSAEQLQALVDNPNRTMDLDKIRLEVKRRLRNSLEEGGGGGGSKGTDKVSLSVNLLNNLRVGSDGSLLMEGVTGKEKTASEKISAWAGRAIYGASSNNGNFMIDTQASMSKQTVQALRLLFKAGRISRSVKELLMLDMVSAIAKEGTSLVEVAYELLAHRAQSNSSGEEEGATSISSYLRRNGGSSSSSSSSSNGEGALEEFADQCQIIFEQIVAKAELDEEEDDETETEDEEDEEEP